MCGADAADTQPAESAAASKTDRGLAGAVFAGGTAPRVGSFTYDLEEDTWEWSPAVAAMHGYAQEQMSPTTEIVLGHIHQDDRPAVREVLARIREALGPFSSRHRIVDVRGSTRVVVLAGQIRCGANDNSSQATGFFIDVTEARNADVHAAAAAMLDDSLAARVLIEQAKGVLMLAYGIGADSAFDLLVWRSQQTNTKVRFLAANLVAAVSQGRAASLSQQEKVSSLLLAAHMEADPSQ